MISALNGRLPDAALVVVDGAGHRLRADAAASYARMRAAGCPAGITSAYRTLGEQTALRTAYLAGGATAALPGQSQHGEGLALDLPEPARTWVRIHHAEHGWRVDRVRGEPWHQEYDPAGDPLAADDDTTEDIMASIEDLRTALTEVIRSEGVSGAGDLGRLATGLDAPLRRIVSEETTKVLRSEGVSGAADASHLAAAIVAALPTSGAGLTQADVEAAVRAVFADAARS